MDPLEELFNLFEAELVTPKKVTPVKRKPPIAPFEDEPQGRSPDSIVKGLSGGLDRLAADMKGGSDANHPKLQDSNPMVRGPQDTKPELDPDGTPTVGTPPAEVHPEAERNERIRGDITQGLSPEDSFTAEFGREPTARDAAEIAKLQGTYTDDKLKNILNPDKDSESVFGKEMKDQEGPTPEQQRQQYENDVQRITNRVNNEVPDVEVEKLRTNTQPEITPEQQQAQKADNDYLVQALERIFQEGGGSSGAGKYDLSDDDIDVFTTYIKNGTHPNVQRRQITDDQVDFAIDYLKQKYGKGKNWIRYQNMLKGKGDPPREMKNAARAKDVLRSYLEYGGYSFVTGEPLSMSASQLDHITSLDNGGVDGGDNWSWMETRFNQTKSALTDEQLLAKLQKMRDQDPDDKRLKDMEKSLSNKIRGGWGEYFKTKGWDNITQGDINGAKGVDGMQMLKALANAAGVSYYMDRGKMKGDVGGVRSSGRALGGAAVSIDELKSRLINQLDIPSTDQDEMFDEDLVELMQMLSDQTADAKDLKKQIGAKRRVAKKTVKECYLEWILEAKFNYFVNPDRGMLVEADDETGTELLDIVEEYDYTNDDVDYLRTYGRA